MTVIIDLRTLRQSRQLTQEALALQLGISRQSVIQIEHGRFLPSLELLERLSAVFALTFDELVGRESRVQYLEDDEQLLVEVALPARTRRELIETRIEPHKVVVRIPKA